MNRPSRREQFAAWCVGVGILIGMLGASGLRYIPMRPEEEEAERDLRRQIVLLQEKLRSNPLEIGQQLEPLVVELQRRQSMRQSRVPPYREIGQWGMGVGLLLSGFGLIWFRHRLSEGKWVRTNEDV